MEGRAGRLGIALLVAVLVVVSQSSVARAAPTATQTIHLLVHFAAGTSDVARAAAVRQLGGTIEGEIRALGVTRIALTIERGADPNAVLRLVAAQPNVSVVEQDSRVHLDWTPNDPLWNTDPYVGLGQWGDKKVSLDRARDLVGALVPITVAVIDTGVDAGHPDLAGVVLSGITILSSQSAGCNADGIGTDDNSHGTHVSGIIAADANNALGIAGVAPNARILPIKALDCTGSGSLFDIASAIAYAVDHGARVINISLGSSSDSPTLETAVQYAVSRNVLIVAAVGNCGVVSSRCFNVQNLVEYPGASPGVLGVGATATDDSIASFSTQGAQVGITAPGVRIVSTTPHYPTYQSSNGGTMNYAAFSGTSQATPFVAGAVALLLGMDPTLTAQQVSDRLKMTADDLGAVGPDAAFGAGRLNLLRAVSATLPAFSARYDTSFVPRSATSGATFTAKVAVTNTSQSIWSASGTSAVKLSYHWFDANGNVAVWDGVRSALPADVAPGTTVTVNMNVLAPPTRGAYTLRIDLVRDGLAWFSQRGVAPADVSVAVGSGLGATYAPAAASATLVTTAPAPLGVTLTNTGTTVWRAGGTQPTHLAYHWVRTDGTIAVWDGARAPAFANDVSPGQTVTVQLPVAVPPDLGTYALRLDLVQEGLTWFSTEGVTPRDVAYLVTTGYAASYVAPVSGSTFLPGTRIALKFGAKNTGLVAWAASGTNPVHIASHIVDASGNVVLWDGARTALAADVAPGVDGTYLFTLDAPLSPGAYRARVDLVREGVVWFSGLGIVPSEAAFSVVADYRAQILFANASAVTVSRSNPTLQVSLTNVTSAIWNASGPYPVHVAAHWYDAAGNVLAWDGPRTALPHDVVSGETVSLSVALGAPPAGARGLAVDLVEEGVRWFGAGQRVSVTLLP